MRELLTDPILKARAEALFREAPHGRRERLLGQEGYRVGEDGEAKGDEDRNVRCCSH